MKIVLEPVFEADMLPCSFGFRPRRSAHYALLVSAGGGFQARGPARVAGRDAAVPLGNPNR